MARYLSVAGRRAVCVVAGRGQPSEAGGDEARASAVALGAWSAGAVPASFATSEGVSQRQRMIESLAKLGILSSRGFPFRSCPKCQTPRTPETIVYQSERGPAYLVRFQVRDAAQPTSLLVWTDNPWKLLATSAVLVSPDLPYVTAVYRRRGVVERIILAKSAIPRLQGWLPGCEIEILEERTGGSIAGTAYVHPLATESPQLSLLEPPAGTVLATSEVGDSGTGLVGSVPRHGAADSQVATALRVDGPVVVTPAGLVKPEPRHKSLGPPDRGHRRIRPARPAGLGPHLRRAHRATRGSALRDLWLGPHLAARPRLVPRDRPITGDGRARVRPPTARGRVASRSRRSPVAAQRDRGEPRARCPRARRMRCL